MAAENDLQVAPVDPNMFSVVFSVHPVSCEFYIAGVFSKPDDADEFASRLKSQALYCNKGVVRSMPMEHVIDLMVRDRLGKIADLIAPILAMAAR